MYVYIYIYIYVTMYIHMYNVTSQTPCFNTCQPDILQKLSRHKNTKPHIY